MKGTGCLPTQNVGKYEIEWKGAAEGYCRSAYEPVIDQGDTNICVSVSLKEIYAYRRKFNRSLKEISDTWIYQRRKDRSQDKGMQILDGLEILEREGLIKAFAALKNTLSIKSAIFLNGGAVLALKVRNGGARDFWKGGKVNGYHAVAAIGYDKKGVVIKNSWGRSWGDEGLATIPYNELNEACIEAWTIIQ